MRATPLTPREAELHDACERLVAAARLRTERALGGYTLPSTRATDGTVFSLLAPSVELVDDLVRAGLHDRCLTELDPTHPYVAAVPGAGPNGREVPGAAVRRGTSDAVRDAIVPAALVAELREGRTFIVHRIDQYDRGSLRALVEDLELVCDTAVGVNCYVSGTGAEGFGCHWDDHDVIVVQTVGRKLWEVFEPTHLSPLRGYVGDEATGRSVWSGVIEPGQAMFIPRGWAHRVVNLEEMSVHHTISLNAPTFVDLVDSLAHGLDDLGLDVASLRRWVERTAGDGVHLATTTRAALRGERPTRAGTSLEEYDAWARRGRAPEEVRVLLTGPPAFVGPPGDGVVTLRWAGLDVEMDDDEVAILSSWPNPSASSAELADELLAAGLARIEP